MKSLWIIPLILLTGCTTPSRYSVVAGWPDVLWVKTNVVSINRTGCVPGCVVFSYIEDGQTNQIHLTKRSYKIVPHWGKTETREITL